MSGFPNVALGISKVSISSIIRSQKLFTSDFDFLFFGGELVRKIV